MTIKLISFNFLIKKICLGSFKCVTLCRFHDCFVDFDPNLLEFGYVLKLYDGNTLHSRLRAGVIDLFYIVYYYSVQQCVILCVPIMMNVCGRGVIRPADRSGGSIYDDHYRANQLKWRAMSQTNRGDVKTVFVVVAPLAARSSSVGSSSSLDDL